MTSHSFAVGRGTAEVRTASIGRLDSQMAKWSQSNRHCSESLFLAHRVRLSRLSRVHQLSLSSPFLHSSRHRHVICEF